MENIDTNERRFLNVATVWDTGKIELACHYLSMPNVGAERGRYKINLSVSDYRAVSVPFSIEVDTSGQTVVSLNSQ